MDTPSEWRCTACGFGPMECSEKECFLCQSPKLATQCATQGALPPVHPPAPKVNVSRGIAVGRTPRRGGRRKNRKNKTRKNKKSLRRRR
jgi:hypothetical protein